VPSNNNAPTLGAQAGATVDADYYPHNTCYDGVSRDEWLSTAAVRYAKHGLRVGPLEGKAPNTRLAPRGFYSFTNDIPTVRKWWEQCPTANIGVNPPRGVVVIDVDTKSGGTDTWATLCAGRSLPNTLAMTTGSGGWHIWFTLPYKGDVRGQLSHPKSGVDLKTHLGQLVMPPSVHPDTGCLYLIHTWADIAPLPEWLYRHVYAPLKAPKRPRGEMAIRPGAGSGLIRFTAEAPENTRNNSLFWAACRALEDGLDIETELLDAALTAGLPEHEIRGTLRSARNKITASKAGAA